MVVLICGMVLLQPRTTDIGVTLFTQVSHIHCVALVCRFNCVVGISSWPKSVDLWRGNSVASVPRQLLGHGGGIAQAVGNVVEANLSVVKDHTIAGWLTRSARCVHHNDIAGVPVIVVAPPNGSGKFRGIRWDSYDVQILVTRWLVPVVPRIRPGP